jgi:hypothetical protein
MQAETIKLADLCNEIENLQCNVVPSAMPSWQQDQGLLDWLNNLCH